ncbi:TetR/AcrR family transcriptional regulator [Streptomyces endophytica]|uniref:TetR/AcrR family transcriptional regulator n=1 Tax=Streptomyces endophytica TaxID=2991496 RepID=A0ABY6PJH0_9ACTN|nr:TetR/AcrR family transcriptional regulator [Streptomyces endophytica]UZJ33648.1 TetR/AcrR family transcriptional regulator [Streptomyces endophytica]
MPYVRYGDGAGRARAAGAVLLPQLPGQGVPAAQAAAGSPAAPPAGSAAQARRRRQIAEALWRIAAERGLHAASLREVATEAGVSLRAVQYHFRSKHQLLVDALHLLHEENERIARSRFRQDPADPRAVLRAVLEEFLPLDTQRATALRVFAAYYARSLTDPALAAVFLAAEQPLERLVADLIGAARDAGRTAPGLDPWREADLLVSGAVGLGGDVLHRRRTLEDVRRTLDYHLERIFAGDRAPTAQVPGGGPGEDGQRDAAGSG